MVIDLMEIRSCMNNDLPLLTRDTHSETKLLNQPTKLSTHPLFRHLAELSWEFLRHFRTKPDDITYKILSTSEQLRLG